MKRSNVIAVLLTGLVVLALPAAGQSPYSTVSLIVQVAGYTGAVYTPSTIATIDASSNFG